MLSHPILCRCQYFGNAPKISRGLYLNYKNFIWSFWCGILVDRFDKVILTLLQGWWLSGGFVPVTSLVLMPAEGGRRETASTSGSPPTESTERLWTGLRPSHVWASSAGPERLLGAAPRARIPPVTPHHPRTAPFRWETANQPGWTSKGPVRQNPIFSTKI